MIRQLEMLQHLRDLCQSDQRIVAATLYGSFTVGEADRYSDIECALFFDAASAATIDKQGWVEQIAPTLLFFADDFGHYTALFDNLVRGEFHFDSIDDLDKVTTWKGSAWFPSAESAIVVDRTGALTEAMQPLFGQPPEQDTDETVERLIPNFINVMVFGMNVWQRGEYARSLELLGGAHRLLLWMARLVEQHTRHWPTPSKGLEKDLSAGSYARCVKCTAALDPVDLRRAYHASWQWGQELMHLLTARHILTFPAVVVARISAQYFEATVLQS